MPRMRSRLSFIAQQPARAVGGHRDVVLLIGGGRRRIGRARRREVLVLAHQRRGGDLGDHQAGIQARASASGTAAGRSDSVGSTISATRRWAIAPISQWPARSWSAAKATGSAWKLPPETIRPSVEHQRIVGGGVGLDLERPRRLAQQVERRARHLRLAADAVGVLHARVALAVALADRRARPAAPACAAAASIWPAWPRSAWISGSSGAVEPMIASVDSAAVTSAACAARQAPNSPASARRWRTACR